MSAWKSQSLSIPPLALSAAKTVNTISPAQWSERTHCGDGETGREALAAGVTKNLANSAMFMRVALTAVTIDAIRHLDRVAVGIKFRRHLEEAHAARPKQALRDLDRAELVGGQQGESDKVSPTSSSRRT